MEQLHLVTRCTRHSMIHVHHAACAHCRGGEEQVSLSVFSSGSRGCIRSANDECIDMSIGGKSLE